MPFGRVRNVFSQSRLASPNASTSPHESAPQTTADRAITRMSASECFLVRSTRGSGSPAKWRAIDTSFVGIAGFRVPRGCITDRGADVLGSVQGGVAVFGAATMSDDLPLLR